MGPAAVSTQHALVLTNTDKATGKDIRALAAHVQAVVHDRLGLALEPEIQIIEFGTES